MGRWRTMVEAVDVYTVGLGGDSQIKLSSDRKLIIGPQRVVPLCLVCGATLAAPAAPPVDARVEEQACPRCGQQNAAQARFCAQCGKGLLQADEPIPAPPPAVDASCHQRTWRWRALGWRG